MKRLHWMAALALLAGSVCAAPPKEGFLALQDQIVEHTLKNGLRLILLPRHDAPVFSFATVANVGSVDEQWGITGLAHMFEHMAFKGTSRIGTKDIESERKALDKVDEVFLRLKAARRKAAPADQISALEAEFKKAQEEARAFVEPNEFDSILTGMGAVGVNASTSEDFTSYFYSLPSNKMELWMSLESERFLDPVLREFYQERDVVKEERGMRVDSQPIGRLIEEFLGMAYKGHPYGSTGIGTMSDLNSFTRAEAEAFFKKYYVPSNMTISLVGDFDPNEVIPMAETYFGRLPAGPQPEIVESEEPEQNAERRATLYGEGQPIILVGYHKPSGLHPDEPVYQALSAILSSGRTSRLYKSLIRDQQIASNAGGFMGFPGDKYPNLFLFYAFATPGHTNEEVLVGMDKEIERLQKELVGEDELSRVKAKAKAGFIDGLSSDQGMAMALSRQQSLSGNWRDLFDELRKIEAVTREDIQRVAKATFRKSNRTIATFEPQQTGEQTP